MKKGDIVELAESVETEWMERYSDHLFEVKEVYDCRCLVRMLNVSNKERYWFTEKENFRPATLPLIEPLPESVE
jgi:hypothetical protein|tara:strand:+ start:431 stop:652 length:222 start_codon:yes stop_codon:yes gene_type:complete